MAAQPIGKVTEYGIYSPDHKLIKSTRTIPLGAEVRFGFCFEAKVDTPEDSITLVETLSHPAVAGAGGIEDSGYTIPRRFKVERGIARGCAGYRARSKSDLKPGIWKFTLSDGGDDVVVQEFTVR